MENNKYTVLVVDDDSALRQMATKILCGEYEVCCAESGEAAFEMLETDCFPDIILLDIYMPGLSGFETLEKLRESEQASDIPVIFLTGIGTQESELRGMSSGAVDYIRKPFVREILLARIRIHLENGRKIREISRSEKDRQGDMIDRVKFDRETKDFTDTEKKMARLLVLGYSYQEIADTLHYTHNYVRKVASVIYEKKFINKRSELKKLFI